MIRIFAGAVERAELSINIADVRVVDVAVDDVGHRVGAVLVVARALGEISPRVCERAELLQRVM